MLFSSVPRKWTKMCVTYNISLKVQYSCDVLADQVKSLHTIFHTPASGNASLLVFNFPNVGYPVRYVHFLQLLLLWYWFHIQTQVVPILV